MKGLKGIKLEGRKIAMTIAWLVALTGAVLLVAQKRKSPEEQLLKGFKRVILLKYGIDIPSSAGLHEAVVSIDNHDVSKFVDIYSEALYRDRVLTREERETLDLLLKEIRRG